MIRRPPRSTRTDTLFPYTSSSDLVALHPLALELAGAADSRGTLTRALLSRLLIVPAQLHLAIHALALQLLLERAQRLVDVLVPNRSEERRLGKECVSTCTFRWPPVH